MFFLLIMIVIFLYVMGLFACLGIMFHVDTHGLGVYPGGFFGWIDDWLDGELTYHPAFMIVLIFWPFVLFVILLMLLVEGDCDEVDR